MSQSFEAHKAVHEIFRTLAADIRSAILNSNAPDIAARETSRLMEAGEREVVAILTVGEECPAEAAAERRRWRKPSQAPNEAPVGPSSMAGLSYHPNPRPRD
jgi:hypothetical protein